ncbi:MAG: class I SAM-dependent methyltransferase [Acidimicrobiia bacterium]
MDRARIEAFLDTFVELASGAMVIGLLAVADRSGLSSYLRENPTGTAAEIAEGAGLQERYVTEILSGLAAAGVVEYMADSGVFSLPPEHALFIADENSPYFMGGWFDMIPSAIAQVDGVANAAIQGGGVGFEEFGDEMIRGIDRGNSPSQKILLTRKWLSSVPGLIERLEGGLRVADVGCGAGTAAITMASAYPKSNVFGFDVSEESLAMARGRAEGLPNVEFHAYAADEIPVDPGFDLITTFDVIHDLTDPLDSLTRIREALRPGGQYLMMEPNASSRLEENLDDHGALLYGISTLHCMTQSLARGGAGLGAAWGAERAERLADRAGFSTFRPLEDINNRFSAFYLLEVQGPES